MKTNCVARKKIPQLSIEKWFASDDQKEIQATNENLFSYHGEHREDDENENKQRRIFIQQRRKVTFSC